MFLKIKKWFLKKWINWLFFNAVKKGKLVKVKQYVSRGADINTKNRHGHNALMFAAEGGNVDIVRFILEHYVDDIARKDRINEAWMYAVYSNSIDILNVFMQNGADVNAKDKDGMTPLMWAAGYNNPKIVKILIEAGADVNAKDNNDKTPLMRAVWEAHPKIVKILVEAGADVNARDKYGETPLMWAAEYNNPEIVKILVKAGADVNAKDNKDKTPLMRAVEDNDPEIVKILVEAGADVDVRDDMLYWTPLMRAVEDNDPEIVKILVEAGADVDVRDDMLYRTPLMRAVKNNYPEIVKILVEAGAYVNAKDRFDDTPLKLAKLQNNPEIINILKNKSVRPLRINKNSISKTRGIKNNYYLEERTELPKTFKNTQHNQSQTFYEHDVLNSNKKHIYNPSDYDNLIKAIENDDIQNIKLYAQPQYINKSDNNSFTPLMRAIMKRDIDRQVFSIFHDCGADLFAQYTIGNCKRSALELAYLNYINSGNCVPLEEIRRIWKISDETIEKMAKKFNIIDKNSCAEKKHNPLGMGVYDFSRYGSWLKGEEKNIDDKDDYS